MNEIIASSKNAKIKNLVHLQKSAARKKQNRIIIEGVREIEKAFKAGIEIPTIFACEELLGPEAKSLIDKFEKHSIFFTTLPVFNQIAYRQNSGGLIAVGIPKELPLNKLPIADDAIYIILEAVEKPGNLGAILRTADAAGVSGLILCDPQTDIYNPNVIRSSLGCIFTVDVAVSKSTETLKWLQANNIKSFATYLDTEKRYYDQALHGKVAIIMGSESEGLTDFWRDNVDHLIKIPMKGSVDSMNVSVSTAIVLFEAIRQRNQ